MIDPPLATAWQQVVGEVEQRRSCTWAIELAGCYTSGY
jgi:hypothetical protein